MNINCWTNSSSNEVSVIESGSNAADFGAIYNEEKINVDFEKVIDINGK